MSNQRVEVLPKKKCDKRTVPVSYFTSMIIAVLLLTGCAGLLETDFVRISEHQAAPYVRPPIEQILVYNYDELFTAVLDVVYKHETESQLLYILHEGENVLEEIHRVHNEIINNNPVGAFAIIELRINAVRIITHYEVNIEIEYSRTKEQMDSIVSVLSERTIRSHLLNVMSQYQEITVIRSNMQLDELVITGLVKETYYQNPHRVVMLPIVVVESFPQTGVDRIYEIQFGYSDTPGMMMRFNEMLTVYIERIANLTEGNTDSEILLSLVRGLIDSTSFDADMARTIHAHGVQNLAATAYGAMVRASAVGEGFAMAFKALADELTRDDLDFKCYVVLGYLDGMVHAWNIIYLYGDYYHIDVAMSSVNGLETAFLKTDAEFEEMLYTWDRENTVRCEGNLTLDDILSDFEPDNINNDEDTDEPDEDN